MKLTEGYVILKDVRFHAFHGVMPQETKVGADFLVNLRIGYPLGKAIESDKVGDTLNYAEVYDLVKQEMEQSSKLLEHVAGRIVKVIGQHYPLVTKILGGMTIAQTAEKHGLSETRVKTIIRTFKHDIEGL